MTDIIATNQTILVVGGGISGLTAALEVAETDKQVILVEKNSYVGGRVVQLHKYFPKLCHPICGMEINQRRAQNTPNLTILTLATVLQISGNKGDYTVRIKTSPRYIKANCTACGQCTERLNPEFENEFDYGHSKRKGIYLAYPNAFPPIYVMDPRIVNSEEALRAKQLCPADAIDLNMSEEIIPIKAGAIIWASGWHPYDASKIQAYGYDRYANVITSLEFERLNDLMGPSVGKILRPSDGKEVNKIAFIQCAGSRDINHLPHCSRVCCMASLKQTTYVSEKSSDARSDIYYIDIRVNDRFEDFYRKIKNQERVNFIRSKVAYISEDKATQNPVLHGIDTEANQGYRNSYDLVVLAIGMEPNVDKQNLPINLSLNPEGFIERDEQNGAIFAAGCCQDALDVNACVRSATASALRAIQVIHQNAGAE